MSGPFHDWGTADSYEHYEPPVSIEELLAQYAALPTGQLRDTLSNLLATPPKWRGPLTTRSIAAIEMVLEEREGRHGTNPAASTTDILEGIKND